MCKKLSTGWYKRLVIAWFVVLTSWGAVQGDSKQRQSKKRGHEGKMENKTEERNKTLLRLQAIAALDAEVYDMKLTYDDEEDVKLTRRIGDRFGEELLKELRMRRTARPDPKLTKFVLEPNSALPRQLSLPIIYPKKVRAMMRRFQQEQFSTAPPLRGPNGGPWRPTPRPPQPTTRLKTSKSGRRWWILSDLLWPVQRIITPATGVQVWSMDYYYYPSETWISKSYYYSTPGAREMKAWCYKKMQESVYRLQYGMAQLNEVIQRNAQHARFQIAYTWKVLGHLVRDIALFWTFLRRRFYYITVESPGTWGTITGIAYPSWHREWWRYVGWRHFGRFRSNDIWRHLVYYTMAARRYIDVMYISTQIALKYEYYLAIKKKIRKARYNYPYNQG